MVSTPIGNLGDFTARAQSVLAACDLILAEDTRVTRKLMTAFGISGRVERCDEETNAQGLRKALEVLAAGGSVAFVSDAGTPAISDPGSRLAQGVIAAGHPVRPVPGASAVLAALAASGLPANPFVFLGFPPPKSGARARLFSQWAQTPATLVLFETGPRLADSLAAMADAFGSRPACVARELTKLYEDFRRGQLDALAQDYAQADPPKGEIVVVIGPPAAGPREASDEEINSALAAAVRTGASARDAVEHAVAITGAPRRRVYALSLSSPDGNT